MLYAIAGSPVLVHGYSGSIVPMRRNCDILVPEETCARLRAIFLLALIRNHIEHSRRVDGKVRSTMADIAVDLLACLSLIFEATYSQLQNCDGRGSIDSNASPQLQSLVVIQLCTQQPRLLNVAICRMRLLSRSCTSIMKSQWSRRGGSHA